VRPVLVTSKPKGNLQMTINANIFNTQKSDYKTPSLFMGQKPGLMDTINRAYPEIYRLYKKMKSLDWDELEFDFSGCNVEFKTCSKSTYEIMIRTLAWQWEADSIASRSITPIVAPFVTSTELWAGWSRIAENEILHAATYSEMVKNSFDNPDDVLNEILSVNESLQRVEVIAEIMNTVYETSHKLSAGSIPKDQKAYNDIFMFVVAMYCLERIQFMASFAVTFAVANTGQFVQFGKAVQKICQDELEVHQLFDRAILDYELRTGEGITAWNQNKDKIQALVIGVIESEFKWVDFLLSEGRELVGLTPQLLKEWVLYSAKDVIEFFNIEHEYVIPAKNPIPFIEDWININRIQPSPQEEKSGQYMLGMVSKDLADDVIEIDL
jgi:ribonucleoside-diphosphate reductase beta chain